MKKSGKNTLFSGVIFISLFIVWIFNSFSTGYFKNSTFKNKSRKT